MLTFPFPDALTTAATDAWRNAILTLCTKFLNALKLVSDFLAPAFTSVRMTVEMPAVFAILGSTTSSYRVAISRTNSFAIKPTIFRRSDVLFLCRKKCQVAITLSRLLATETSYQSYSSAQRLVPLISHVVTDVTGLAVVVMFKPWEIVLNWSNIALARRHAAENREHVIIHVLRSVMMVMIVAFASLPVR
jgi:hypothetical protein